MANFKPEKIKKSEAPLLLHPPMVEAIFELRWELIADQQTGRMRDPSYPMMYGRLYERLKKDFSIVEDLPSTQAHPEATPFVPRHRLRKEKNGYPLIQVGPGIITVNDSKDYSWSEYRSLVLRLIESVIELFPADEVPLNFIKAELRYVNGIRFDLARENPLDFLAAKLHMKVEVDPELFTLNELHERPSAVNLNLTYALQKPVGSLGVSFNLGQVDGKPAYIYQALIQSFGEIVPMDRESFSPWLQEAHDVAENCFMTFCKGSLMEKFCGT
ncbi:MAG TPA: TIGR04255 family protein [Chlamydiales bacterium]|nr:TIGR04255 family protein [Chlamydiales bacterium]